MLPNSSSADCLSQAARGVRRVLLLERTGRGANISECQESRASLGRTGSSSPASTVMSRRTCTSSERTAPASSGGSSGNRVAEIMRWRPGRNLPPGAGAAEITLIQRPSQQRHTARSLALARGLRPRHSLSRIPTNDGHGRPVGAEPRHSRSHTKPGRARLSF